ncbi:MAG: ATP-dependent zinc metalloprotease FtsH [Candidatus Borkfalkiaceae bacterium]|nr:ATP-dependent zinc metalloprotease FtsH [bacterium]MDY2851565.1 ATP-dependent zinc metalloprotease FtsH [Christensenellaceae bacterium]
MKKTTKTIIAIISVLVLLFLGYSLLNSMVFGYTKVTTTEFFELCGITTKIDETSPESGKIEYVVDKTKINNVKTVTIDVYALKAELNGRVTIQDKAITNRIACNFSRADMDNELLEILRANGVNVDNTDPNAGSGWSSYIMPLLIMAIGLVIFFMLMRSVNGSNKSAMDFGKTTAKPQTNIKIRFNDVAGAEEEKEELKEIVEFLKNPKKFSDLGARIPKGVLLVGNPGTGKTLFAKAIAGEAGVPFFSISGSDFVEMFVGVGASRVRDLFNTAKKNMPCIVFIDEIDAVGRQRGTGLGGGNDEREQTLNQLLVQMDGFEANEGVIVIAATNRADVLDPALLRPGRFDRQIHVHMPDVRGREAILKVHARNKPMDSSVNFRNVARLTSGFSGADLANLLNEAAILAAREGRKLITNKDIYEGFNKVLMGPAKKSRLVTEKDKRITAYHEAGHALLARLLPNCDPVHEVTIIPRGDAGGYTMTRPATDDEFQTKNRLLDRICMGLGGRIAEELIIEDVSSGASGDIKMITDVARVMVTRLGMSERLGTVLYGGDGEVFIGRDMGAHMSYSDETAKVIDDEIERIVKEQKDRGTKILSENVGILHSMARLLVERETIYNEEIEMLVQGKSVQDIEAYMDEVDKNGGHKNQLEKEFEAQEGKQPEQTTENK